VQGILVEEAQQTGRTGSRSFLGILVGRAGAKRNTTEEEIFLRRICGRAALLHAALESRRGILPVKIAIFLWRA
jgi:hypothetical protein